MKSYFKLLMFVCTILLLSCNKEKNENIISNESEYYIEKLYYIDNVKVDNFNDFSLSQKSDSLYRFDTYYKDSVVYMIFTSEDQLIEYSLAEALKIEKLLKFERMIHSSTDTNMLSLSSYNNLPESWNALEDSLYTNTFDPSRALCVTLFKDNDCRGKSVIMFKTLAAMHPGWNNCTSSISFTGFYGCLAIYDKTFYRNRLAIVRNIGSSYINLSNYNCDNKMSSGVLWY